MSTDPAREPDERDLADQDPIEVLRRMLAISPEDAEAARDAAAKPDRERAERDQEGDDS